MNSGVSFLTLVRLAFNELGYPEEKVEKCIRAMFLECPGAESRSERRYKPSECRAVVEECKQIITYLMANPDVCRANHEKIVANEARIAERN